MGLEDLSLDDIIKKRKTAKKNSRQNAAMDKPVAVKTIPQQQFQRKKFFNVNQQTKVVDARQLLQKKTQVVDAREKIKAKSVIDARQKLQQRQQEKNFGLSPPKQALPIGKIPKVTILNNEYRAKPPGIPKITFHVTQPARQPKKAAPSVRTNQSFTSKMGGIKVAVRNEFATARLRQRPVPVMDKKPFEKLKITTINKDAIEMNPMGIRPTSRPNRKRALPQPIILPSDDDDDDDESMEDTPPRPPPLPRRQQRVEEEPPLPVKRSKPDSSTLRPMMSQRTQAKKPSNLDSDSDDESLPGASPIEGTKLQVFNLHPVVTEDDILELFSVLGAVRRARLVKPGEAEVVYIKNENAFAAYKKYNNRDLDGQPMQIKIVSNETAKPAVQYSWMKEVKSSRKKSDLGDVTELHSGVLQQALFKGGSTGTSTRPVVFTVKI